MASVLCKPDRIEVNAVDYEGEEPAVQIKLTYADGETIGCLTPAMALELADIIRDEANEAIAMMSQRD